MLGKYSMLIGGSMKSALFLICMVVTCLIGNNALAMSNTSTYQKAFPALPESRAEIGSPAPVFTLEGVVDLQIKKVSLAEYQGKWVVLFFYPADFSLVCPTEIKGFNKALPDFRQANAEVLAVSVDSKFSHLAWIKSGALDKLDYPLLSDFSKQVSRAYGVLNEENSAARRGLFIIDPNGVIQYRVVHSDKVGRSVEETLRVLKALQTEELCPLNWKPGEKTLKK